MAFSKAHRFSPCYYHLSLLCSALSHPARVSIIDQLIATDGALPVKALHQGLPISLAALSQHLKILRDMYILKCETATPTVMYRLNEDCSGIIAEITQLIAQAHFNHEHFSGTAMALLGKRRLSGTVPF